MNKKLVVLLMFMLGIGQVSYAFLAGAADIAAKPNPTLAKKLCLKYAENEGDKEICRNIDLDSLQVCAAFSTDLAQFKGCLQGAIK